MTPIFALGDGRTLKRLRRLRQQAHTDKAPRVALRIQAVMLSIQKHTSGQISGLLQMSRARIHAWVRAWNEHGIEGIKEGHRSGRPQVLQEKQLQQLYDIVDSGPQAYGLSTGVWTSPILRDIIKIEFGVTYHPGHVRKVLKKIGLSVQRPTTRLAASDAKAQRKWIRYTYPDLKKRPKPNVQPSYTKTKPRSGKARRSTKRGRH